MFEKRGEPTSGNHRGREGRGELSVVNEVLDNGMIPAESRMELSKVLLVEIPEMRNGIYSSQNKEQKGGKPAKIIGAILKTKEVQLSQKQKELLRTSENPSELSNLRVLESNLGALQAQITVKCVEDFRVQQGTELIMDRLISVSKLELSSITEDRVYDAVVEVLNDKPQ